MFTKILVPLDQSELAEAVLPLVTSLAKCYDAEIVLFHVVTPTRYYAPEMMIGAVEVEETMRAEANMYLKRLATSLTDRGFKVSAVQKDDLGVANAILDYADHNGIELIAMSTHGRSGIGRWLLGSVADKVVHGAQAPVLLVRSEETKR